ncbi:MAG: hypothetical protein IH845_04655 [Nanoarchaeota archaeon]|nr:hypothetical protein [Nanoarchaeota archaeon]
MVKKEKVSDSSDTKLKVFKGVAWFAGLYHILLGLIGTFAPTGLVLSIVSGVFGVVPTASDQFFYLTKFISAYMIAFGFMLVLMAREPKKYSIFVWPAVTMFGIRIFDRIVFFDLLNSAFGSTMLMNMRTIIPISILILIFIYTRPKNN